MIAVYTITHVVLICVGSLVVGLIVGFILGYYRGHEDGYQHRLTENIDTYHHEQAGEDPVVEEHDGFRIIKHEPNGDGE